jgi:hypothetical protein
MQFRGSCRHERRRFSPGLTRRLVFALAHGIPSCLFLGTVKQVSGRDPKMTSPWVGPHLVLTKDCLFLVIPEEESLRKFSLELLSPWGIFFFF